MKVLVAIVLGIAFVPCMVRACDCLYPKYRPDPDTCCKYYVCDNCVETHMTCPNGLHWNNKTNSCDWPCNAGCGTGSPVNPIPGTTTTTTPSTTTTSSTTTTPSTTTTTTTTSTTTTIPGPTSPGGCDCECKDGDYTSGDSCCKYKVCVAGKYVDMTCAGGLHWNNKTKACDWPCYAGCANGTGTSPPVITPPPGTGCGECESGAYAAVDGEACKYKACANGCWTTLKCPAGLIWDQALTSCKWQICANSKQ
ncbi:unnamed protein product [Hermetia illucens]|uniref:Chitin-binding type-2 domain-containing protein n=2 Tax=Hermetia illucens TaxID=343691 RepID=A0A7R8UGX4_HERIL|nr:unnamed protein product [Hermetia illucens]